MAASFLSGAGAAVAQAPPATTLRVDADSANAIGTYYFAGGQNEYVALVATGVVYSRDNSLNWDYLTEYKYPQPKTMKFFIMAQTMSGLKFVSINRWAGLAVQKTAARNHAGSVLRRQRYKISVAECQRFRTKNHDSTHRVSGTLNVLIILELGGRG